MDGISKIKIFAGSSGKDFAMRICKYLNIDLGKSEVITFTEGNIYVKACETVRNKDVYIVQSIGLNPNNEFTEILFWIDAFKRASAKSVTLVMPYYSYAKGDKTDEPRVSIRGRVCAECIELAGADRIITMDLHSPQIQGFFKKPVDHLVGLPVICEYIKSLNIENIVTVSPDAGYAKQARKYAKYLGTPLAIGDKEREDHNENAKIVEIIGEVSGMNALIVDDFSISAGTIVDLAYELKRRGVNEIYACLSHILMNEKAVKKLEDSPIKYLISTDTLNNPYIRNSSKIKIISVAQLFGETISRIHKNKSISNLSENFPQKTIKIEVV